VDAAVGVKKCVEDVGRLEGILATKRNGTVLSFTVAST
jgi:hypothetical protein